jgi:hypothetical protein
LAGVAVSLAPARAAVAVPLPARVVPALLLARVAARRVPFRALVVVAFAPLRAVLAVLLAPEGEAGPRERPDDDDDLA